MESSFYLYFIVSHELTKDVEIVSNPSEKYIYQNTLEILCSEEYQTKEKITYNISINRIKMDESIKNKKIKNGVIFPIILYCQGDEYEAQTYQDFDTKRNCFLFDLRFVKKKNCKNDPPKELFMYNSFKFDLYIKVLKDIFCYKIEDQESKDLIYDAQKFMDGYLEEKKKKYNEYLYFFADILMESFDSKDLLQKHLLNFDVNKIDEKKIQFISSQNAKIKESINSMIDNIETIFKDLDTNSQKTIVSVFLNFNAYFQRNKINEILEKAGLYDIICDILFENPQKYKIDLNLEYIDKLIKKSDSPNKMIEMFIFNNNFFEILEVININNYHILHTCKDKKLYLEKNITPAINDDLDKIYEQIYALLYYEEVTSFFVKFSEKIFNQYIDLFKDDFNKLITVYKIIKLIREKDKSFKMNPGKVQKKINERRNILIKEKKIKNDELFNFIRNTENINEEEFSILIEQFDIKETNSEFWKNWKDVNWLKLCKNNKKKEIEFLTSISNKIDNIQNFGKIYQLFDVNEKERDYNIEMIQTMQNTFIDLNKGEKTRPIVIEDACNLIIYSEMKKVSVKHLIHDNILVKNDEETINQIFMELIKKNDNNYSEELINEIVPFISKNIEKSNISSLSFLIKYKDPLEQNDINYLNKYALSEEDFFDIKGNEKLVLFSDIIKIDNISKKLSNSEYLRSYESIVNTLPIKLKDGNIKYKTISPFYLDDKKELLKNRLLLMSLNKEDEGKEKYNEINEYMNSIDSVLSNLGEINDYLKSFFPESEKNTIKKIDNFISNINKNNLNYCNTMESEYLEIIEKYLNDAKENSNISKNVLIISITKNIRKIYKYDEKDSLLEAKKSFVIIKVILYENSININKIYKLGNSINSNEINTYEKFIELIDISKEALCESINLLINNLNLPNEVNVDKICNELILLSQKKKIEFLVELFIDYIEKFDGKRTELYSVLKVIKNNIQKSKEIKVIEMSKSILKNYKIDLDSNDHKYIDILYKLAQNRKKHEFLLDTKNHTEYFLKKIRKINNENNNSFINTEKCILFVKKYMNPELKQLKDKELITTIKKDFGNLDIINQFNDYLDKYQILIDNFLL